MKKNKNLLYSIIVVGILLGLSILFVKPIEGFSWKTIDYGGNDIKKYKKFTVGQCKVACQSDPKCVGIISEVNDNNIAGDCWLKSKFENGTASINNRYPLFLTR
jgi:hypothetical protein